MENTFEHFGTFWSLIPPIFAILLALITKRVYSSLFTGIVVGCFLISGNSFVGFIDTLFKSIFAQISEPSNIYILIFIVILSIISTLIQKAGGATAFGNWTQKKIHSKKGALFSTVCSSIILFIDDYFSCMTVGNIMRPITDKFKISREKLSYIIDSTSAPICIIVPFSSWTMAIVGFFHNENGFMIFIKSIPFNFYALFTLLMMFFLISLDFDFGPMKKFEQNVNQTKAQENNLVLNQKSTTWDLIIPIFILIVLCFFGLVYTGGFFKSGYQHKNFFDAFLYADTPFGLMLGSFATLICIILFYSVRGVFKFSKCIENLPKGFKSVIPAIFILILAWTLKGVTDQLGTKQFVSQFISNYASSWINLLPAFIFLIGAFLAFAIGTSWGTFGLLIPIVISIFNKIGSPLMIISISACVAGAVCGDHCSPISDTTIMSSTGAQCKHINHVSTQLPYALFVAMISFITYIFAGYVQNAILSLLFGGIFLFSTLLIVKKLTNKSA